MRPQWCRKQSRKIFLNKFKKGLDIFGNHVIIRHVRCGCSSSGRAPPCQGGGSEFEPRHPLQETRPFPEGSGLVSFLANSGSKNQSQQSGGLLLAAGWTAATPLCCPTGTTCKRASSPAPKNKTVSRGKRSCFLLALTAMTLLNISMSLEFTIFLCYNYFIRQSNEVLRFVCSAFFL